MYVIRNSMVMQLTYTELRLNIPHTCLPGPDITHGINLTNLTYIYKSMSMFLTGFSKNPVNHTAMKYLIS